MKIGTQQSKTRVASLEASPKLTSLEASPIMPLAQGCFARVNLLIGKFTLKILSRVVVWLFLRNFWAFLD